MNSMQRCLTGSVIMFLAVSCSESKSSSSDIDVVASEAQTQAALMNLNEETPDGVNAAAANLEAAVANNPGNDLANFLVAPTRVAKFANDFNTPGSRLTQLLEGAGIDFQGATAFDILNGTALDPISSDVLPDNTPTAGAVQAFLRHDLLKLVQESIENLEAVSGNFSATITLGDATVEVDFGDAQFLITILRTWEIQLLLAVLIDFNADIDALDNWDQTMQQPYRLFTGESRFNIIQFKESDIGRLGLLNEADALLTSNTFLPVADAQVVLDQLRAALIGLIRGFLGGATYVEDPNSTDDLMTMTPTDLQLFSAIRPWVEDVIAALEAHGSSNPNDFVVEPLIQNIIVEGGGIVSIDLPGFEVRSDLIFSPETYNNRPFLPDYGVVNDGTIAQVESFDVGGVSALNDIIIGFGDDPITAQDLYDSWQDINRDWDQIFVDFPVEKFY